MRHVRGLFPGRRLAHLHEIHVGGRLGLDEPGAVSLLQEDAALGTGVFESNLHQAAQQRVELDLHGDGPSDLENRCHLEIRAFGSTCGRAIRRLRLVSTRGRDNERPVPLLELTRFDRRAPRRIGGVGGGEVGHGRGDIAPFQPDFRAVFVREGFLLEVLRFPGVGQRLVAEAGGFLEVTAEALHLGGHDQPEAAEILGRVVGEILQRGTRRDQLGPVGSTLLV